MNLLIDGYEINKILTTNKKYTKEQIHTIYIQELKKHQTSKLNRDIASVVNVLIDNYGFKDMGYDENIQCDYCIDTDVDIVYKIIH